MNPQDAVKTGRLAITASVDITPLSVPRLTRLSSERLWLTSPPTRAIRSVLGGNLMIQRKLMKSIRLLLLASVLTNVQAQVEVTSERQPLQEPQIVEKGASHRVWEQLWTTTTPEGRTITNRSSFTELASGMHHLVNGE